MGISLTELDVHGKELLLGERRGFTQNIKNPITYQATTDNADERADIVLSVNGFAVRRIQLCQYDHFERIKKAMAKQDPTIVVPENALRLSNQWPKKFVSQTTTLPGSTSVTPVTI